MICRYWLPQRPGHVAELVFAEPPAIRVHDGQHETRETGGPSIVERIQRRVCSTARSDDGEIGEVASPGIIHTIAPPVVLQLRRAGRAVQRLEISPLVDEGDLVCCLHREIERMCPGSKTTENIERSLRSSVSRDPVRIVGDDSQEVVAHSAAHSSPLCVPSSTSEQARAIASATSDVSRPQPKAMRTSRCRRCPHGRPSPDGSSHRSRRRRPRC
jgi:hypothetical protein